MRVAAEHGMSTSGDSAERAKLALGIPPGETLCERHPRLARQCDDGRRVPTGGCEGANSARARR